MAEDVAKLRQLMARTGHATPQAALTYQHATAERDRAIADALGLMIEATSAGPSVNDDQAMVTTPPDVGPVRCRR